MPTEIDKDVDHLMNDLLDTIIVELKTNENFNFSNSKIFDILEAENLQKFEKMIPKKLLNGDFVFIQRKILGFLLFFKSLNASVPFLQILKKYNLKVQN